MYHDVYFHKTAVAAGLLMERLLTELKPRLLKITSNWNRFQQLTDGFVMFQCIDDDTATGMYARRLYNRKLPKFLHEELVSADVPFSEQRYLTRWFGDNTLNKDIKITKTRTISGLNRLEFEKYRIYFHNSKTNDHLFSCTEILDSIHWKPAQKPYYIVRAYKF